jgi:hypothetical protein
MNTLQNIMKGSVTMTRFARQLLPLALLTLALSACQESRGERSYVQTNVLRKDVLEGEWYYSRWVVDHNFESSYFTFKGDATWDYSTSTMARIRWIIDENYLYAVRTYEVVAGANIDGGSSTFLGEPLAAFPIDSHFDIQRQYNPATGETAIVTEENTRDRMWWERDYMRVDWTTNNVMGYYWAGLDAYEALGYVERQAVALPCDEGSECPDGWQVAVENADCPQSCRDVMRVPFGMDAQLESTVTACAGELGVSGTDVAAVHRSNGTTLTWADLAPWWTLGCQYIDEIVDDPSAGETPPYYLSLVTNEIWSPSFGPMGQFCSISMGIPCTSFHVAVRNTFLRSTNVPDYEPFNVPNSVWNRFGVIRLSQNTWTRGGLPDEEEGLTRSYGMTDALNYWGAKHDFWSNDLQVGSDGRRVPGNYRPLAERAVKPILYTMTRNFPPYLVEPSMQAAWNWNEAMMKTVRQVRGIALPEDGGPAWGCQLEHPTCAECDPHDISEFGGRLDQWDATSYKHRFTGTECALVLQTNPCDYDADLAPTERRPCAEMGDIRYHFWAMIDTPGAPFGGVSLPLQDSRDGRLVSANVNIVLESIEDTSTWFLMYMGLAAPADLVGAQWEPWTRGEEWVLSGEWQREYYANLGKVEHPRTWAPYGPVAIRADSTSSVLYDPMLMAPPEEVAAGRAVLDRLRPKLERLQGMEGRAMTMSNRLYSLQGSQLERDLTGSLDTLADYASTMPAGLNTIPNMLQTTDEQVLDAVSPFRVNYGDRLAQRRTRDMKRFDARHCFFPLDEMNAFTDYSLLRAAREFKDYSPAQVAIELRRRINKWIFIHEFGHSVGMEHNFGASADPANYHDEYYEIASQHPLPSYTDGRYVTCRDTPDPHTGDTVCGQTAEDLAEFWGDYRAAKQERELDGIDSFTFSSVMDYPAEMYNYFHDLGRYDFAYTLFAYGGRREVYNGDPRVFVNANESVVPFGSCDGGSCTHTCSVDPGTGAVTCPWLRKLPYVYYVGGQKCETDSDCPYSRGKGTLWAGDGTPGGGPQEDVVAQRCVENYRQEELDASAAQLPKICSNFEEDWKRYQNSFSPNFAPYFATQYKNCGNSRTNDISWCSMFDEGASFREIIENFRERYDRYYMMSHFRLYRNGYGGTSIWRYMDFIGKMFQHFWYRLWYEGGDFDFSEGLPQFGYGAWDQFYASADALSWIASIITTHDVGSYSYDSTTDSYQLKESETYDVGDLNLGPGLGKYMWSRYENGLTGFTRMARMGMLQNKIEAMLALVLRDWGMSYGMDERFYFNFYDVFTSEMNLLFGGIMLDNPSWYGPRMTGTTADPGLTYPSFWQGFLCGSSLFFDTPLYCAPDIRTQYPGTKGVGGGSNVILRNYASAFALAEFPVFFNTSYEQQMYVALDGGGDYFEIPGCDVPAMLAAGTPENANCVVYESTRLHKSYVAAKMETPNPWAPDYHPLSYESFAAELLHEMNALETLIGQLENPATPLTDLAEQCRTTEGRAACLDHAKTRLQGHESFMLSLVETMHTYGISSWF